MNYGKNALKRRQSEIAATGAKIKHKIIITLCQIFLICALIIVISTVAAGIGVMNGIIDSAPDISEIDVIPTGYSTTVYAGDGKTTTATLVASGANRQYVTIDEIPLYMQHAFVAIEDARFYEHNGIDLAGIARAAAIGFQSGKFSQGASTITQQLIKNSVLEETWESESSLIESFQRKIQEQFLAVQLEEKVNNKDWILENYMNTINLGANTLGVQAASEKYFGKDVSELSLSECAVIAAITQNPVKYNPILHPEHNITRQKKVLKNMRDQKYISQEEYESALADDVYSRIAEHNLVDPKDVNSVNSYFVDAMIDDVYNDLMEIKGYSETEAYKAIYQGGLSIYSTQDLDMQKICDEEVNDAGNYGVKTQYSFALSFQVKQKDGTYKNYSNQTMLSYYKKATHNENFDINYNTEEECYEAIKQYESDVLEKGDEIVEGSESVYITLEPEVAMTIIDHETGEVKALVGGRGDKAGNRTWNRATDTKRQPGSTFKVIACFAPAIDSAGLTIASTQNDAPLTVGTKKYRNYDGKYRGPTSIRSAITNSVNIVTVKNLQEIGIDLGYEYAEKFGITSLVDQDKNLGLCLGGLTYGVTNLELAGAYAAIANKGEYIKPSFYTKVLDHDGNVLIDNSMKQHRRVLKETSAYILTSAMEDVMKEGTGKKAYFGDKMAQAGKTGTTTSNRDSLFAGFTPYYTCVLWGGYDDNSKLPNTQYTKQIWRKVMKRIHEGKEKKEFEKPDGVVELRVCRSSGLLAGGGCSAYTELFDEDNAPTTICTKHTGSGQTDKNDTDKDDEPIHIDPPDASDDPIVE